LLLIFPFSTFSKSSFLHFSILSLAATDARGLDNAPSKTEAARLTAALVDQAGTTVKPRKQEILDIDTFCAAHGGQQRKNTAYPQRVIEEIGPPMPSDDLPHSRSGGH
jgi:hypothetical protein